MAALIGDSAATDLSGHPSLQLPRCAALVQYGGGDGMRMAVPLECTKLDASALPARVRDEACAAVDAAVAQRNAGAFESLVSEHVATSWDRAACSWEVAVALTVVRWYGYEGPTTSLHAVARTSPVASPCGARALLGALFL